MIPEDAKSVGAITTVSTTTVVEVCESEVVDDEIEDKDKVEDIDDVDEGVVLDLVEVVEVEVERVDDVLLECGTKKKVSTSMKKKRKDARHHIPLAHKTLNAL
jgi:hypothetical protein